MGKQKKLKIIPLGGLGEVGKNMMVYEYGGEILIVDSGIMFPENDMLGIDYIIPDFHYLLSKRHQVRGIIITHGHEDHLGAIHHVLEEIQAPIYATKLTRGLLEGKLARRGMVEKAKINTISPGDTVKIGPFQVEFFHVCHSVPDGVGMGIQTPAGLVVHSGDFKFDHTPVDNWPTDYSKLAEFSKRGVLALLSDSTNAERPGWTPSERVIDSAFDDVFREAKGRIIIASFASLISRMQQAVNTAEKYGRKLAFVGTSMVDNSKIARKLGYLNAPEDLVIPIDQAVNMADKDVVLMCTGSQGEPTSILGRLTTDSYRLFNIKEGDTFILSSHPIPGNEETVNRTINRLFQRGAHVIYEEIAPVHVSGHASQEELKLLINMVRPKHFIPIHGELRHLKRHATLAEELGIPSENIAVLENGQSVVFTGGKMKFGERVPNAYIFVDGSGVGDIDPVIMRERSILSREGVVLVNLLINKRSKELIKDPDIKSQGFIMADSGQDILSKAKNVIIESLSRSNGDVEESIRRAMRSYLYGETRRRPKIFVSINEI
ncbi:MAG: ribonuclease J [Anaerolineaceae bacterium]|nr:ribonuclease J [Anaerolineaceae bacterium]